MNIFLDCETLPTLLEEEKELLWNKIAPPANYKKDESRKAWLLEHGPVKHEKLWQKTAVNPTWATVICICTATDTDKIKTFTNKDLKEKKLLTEWWQWIDKLTNEKHSWYPTFVGHNVKFDLSLIHHRSIINRVPMPMVLPYLNHPVRKEYFCTQFQWTGAYRPEEMISLSNLCRALKIETEEDEISGKDVFDAWAAGRWDLIEKHCKLDVQRVREIHKLLEYDYEPA